MNDFDYSKPYAVAHGRAGSNEESKERFDSLLDKLGEVAQKTDISAGEATDHVISKELNNESSGNWSLSYKQNLNTNPVLGAAAVLGGTFGDLWKISYTSPKGKIIDFKFNDSQDGRATVSLKLSQKEISSSMILGTTTRTKVLYELSCEVLYAEDSDAYFKALGTTKRDKDYQEADKRLWFFTAIGKTGVFDALKRLTDGLYERIANEKQSATDAQKSADKKAFEDALGDL